MTNRKTLGKVLIACVALAICVAAAAMILIIRSANARPGRVNLSEGQAKEIALRDAGETSDRVTFTKCVVESEDGRTVYEVDFYTDEKEYDYQIDCETGEIYTREVEAFTGKIADKVAQEKMAESEQPADAAEIVPEENAAPAQSDQAAGAGQQKSAASDASTYIGVEKAKTIALQHAGLSAKQVRFAKAYLDHDDGVAVYDISFSKGRREYDYEIDAQTGRVLQGESDVEDDLFDFDDDGDDDDD